VGWPVDRVFALTSAWEGQTLKVTTLTTWCLGAALGIGASFAPTQASACGCFAPPNPATPVVQAGEQIVFGQKDGRVTMHVRVQYSGPAEEFGWLLPMPSVPELQVGTEEIFSALDARTRPQFRTRYVTEGDCQLSFDAGASVQDGGVGFGGDAGTNGPGGVLVRRESVGPYDTAILRADERGPMLDWLRDNSFFIPDALADAVGPYIRPGGYFLALKLLKDRDAGDLAPIVLDYPSDLPMIPMVLTQVGADPDMPVTVYVLGEHRAIPRNFRHTIINEERIDWFAAGRNYEEVVTAAVDEADGHHSFVTEFAGASEVMRDVLDRPGRFGNRADFESMTDALAYTSALRNLGFEWNTQLVGFLSDTFDMPQGVRDAGFSEDIFYANLDWYLGRYREQNPEQFEGASFEFDPVVLTGRIWAAIVEPTRAAGQLFRDHAKITRMFTTLSPEEMVKDPVFSFNAALPDVSNVHEAVFTRVCRDNQGVPEEGTLALPDGREFVTTRRGWRDGLQGNTTPYSARIEILREEGEAEVEVDNTHLLSPGASPGAGGNGSGQPGEARDRSGCTCTAEQAGAGSLAMFGLLAGVLLGRRRRS